MCSQDYWNTEGLIQPDIHTMSNYFNELQIHLGIYSLGTEIQEKMGNRKEKTNLQPENHHPINMHVAFIPNQEQSTI